LRNWKKSSQITLTVVAAAGLAGCGRRALDPCETQYFNEQACRDAVAQGGYYWNNTYYPMHYQPYLYYYDSYRTYVTRGGHVYSSSGSSYVHSGGSSSTATRSSSGSSSGSSSSSSVTRGGFGSTAAGHGAGE